MTQTQNSENDLIKSFSEIGQDQIFRFWKDLNQAERLNLCKQLQLVDINECITAWEDIQAPKPKVKNIEPPKAVSCTTQDPLSKKQFFDKGELIFRTKQSGSFYSCRRTRYQAWI